jgi:hypothetical protein
MADTGSSGQAPDLTARVARLESDVAHIRKDLTEVKSTLNRLAPRIDEMLGFLYAKLPELATEAELADLRSETRAGIADLRNETRTEFADVRREMAGLRLEVMQRPTRRQSIFDISAIVGPVGAVLTIAAHFAH